MSPQALLKRFAFWLRQFRTVEVTYSRDATFYYVTSAARRKGYWLSVQKRPISEKPADERKAVDGFMSDGVTIRKYDGEEYWREALPFTFYSVKSGDRRRVRANDDLVLDYEALL